MDLVQACVCPSSQESLPQFFSAPVLWMLGLSSCLVPCPALLTAFLPMLGIKSLSHASETRVRWMVFGMLWMYGLSPQKPRFLRMLRDLAGFWG